MTLPAPNLDDRRFQDLVDEAKRLVQQRCPEWTDHNVSDPGVTLIETFAWMVDQLVYRLNRVPDRNYVKFLDMIGVRLFPPAAAHAEITFWLSAPQDEEIRIATGTEVATTATLGDSVSFHTIEDLRLRPCSLDALGSALQDGEIRDHTEAVRGGVPFLCFDQVPQPGDVMYVGLSAPVPSCAVNLRFDCTIEGMGVDPDEPPLVWEAWDGQGWTICDVDRDATGGLNRAGDLVLHVPPTHQASVIGGHSAGWIRCRVVAAGDEQPAYSSSPKISGLTAFTIGGTVAALQADIVSDEVLGPSEGVPGQSFQLRYGPVVANGSPRTLRVSDGDGWVDWSEVSTFNESGPDDPHFVVDAVAGEVLFGPGVREADGSLRRYGAVPPKGATLRLSSYATGGGRRGNVAKGALRILKTSIPYVSRVENRRPAYGGVDGEDLENAKVRGPLILRSGNRAVTSEDYEHLAREAAPDIARIHCAEAGDGVDPGGVRVLIVPAAGSDEGRVRFEQLVPSEATVERIGRYLDERRMIGARVVVEPPSYQGVTVVAKLRARPRSRADTVKSDALRALYEYFNPIGGGPDGSGWPFGRHVLAGEAHAALQRVKGVEYVEKIQLFAADPTTGERSKPLDRIELDRQTLVFSYDHQVRVEEGE